MLRVAVLSFWHVHGKDYAREAEEHPEVELVAIWDEQPERGRAEAERRGVRFYESLDELLAQPDIDGVIVTTPTSMHRDVMLAAARAGKHIFTEKVIAATLREVNEILDAVEQAGVTFMVSMWRSDIAVTKAVKQVIEQGVLGDITKLRIHDGHQFALPAEGFPRGRLPEHFYDPELAQGGALIDLCHPVYLTAHFMGLPERVSATFGYVTGRQVEDNAVVMMNYPKGALAVVETGFVTHSAPFTIEVHGTQGSLIYSEPGISERAAAMRAAPGAEPPQNEVTALYGKLRLRSALVEECKGGWLVQEITVPPAPKAFSQWVAHIQQSTKAPENIDLGRKLTALIEAANRSAASGQAVKIAELEGADRL